jgi:TATA-box binding protein (TBP) (component of TFIID and TFIIIB)
MRIRTLALVAALVFGSGAVVTVHAASTADQKKAAKERNKQLKKLNKERAKNSNAAKYQRPKSKPVKVKQ